MIDNNEIPVTIVDDEVTDKPKKPKKEKKPKEPKKADLDNNIEDDIDDNLEQIESTDLGTDGRSDPGQLLPKPGDLLPRGSESGDLHSGSESGNTSTTRNSRRIRGKHPVSPAVRRWRGLATPNGHKKKPRK